MNKELEEVYKMNNWKDEEIFEELSRPVEPPLDMFQKMVDREAMQRIWNKLCKIEAKLGDKNG